MLLAPHAKGQSEPSGPITTRSTAALLVQMPLDTGATVSTYPVIYGGFNAGALNGL